MTGIATAAQPLLEAVNNLRDPGSTRFRIVSNSPAAPKRNPAPTAALGRGSLAAATRERIALTPAGINRRSYCLSARSYLGKTLARPDDAEIRANRRGRSGDPKASAAGRFAAHVTKARGHASDDDLRAVKLTGLGFGMIAGGTAGLQPEFPRPCSGRRQHHLDPPHATAGAARASVIKRR